MLIVLDLDFEGFQIKNGWQKVFLQQGVCSLVVDGTFLKASDQDRLTCFTSQKYQVVVYLPALILLKKYILSRLFNIKSNENCV